MLLDVATELEARITDILTRAAGPGTDPDDYIVYFDDHLHDVEIESMPYAVVTVRSADIANNETAFSQPVSPRTWTVHIYLLQITETFAEGKRKRNAILERVYGELEQNWNLDNFEVVGAHGQREYVFMTEVTNLLLDYSGQDEYYSFVSELYLTVHTDTTDPS